MYQPEADKRGMTRPKTLLRAEPGFVSLGWGEGAIFLEFWGALPFGFQPRNKPLPSQSLSKGERFGFFVKQGPLSASRPSVKPSMFQHIATKKHEVRFRWPPNRGVTGLGKLCTAINQYWGMGYQSVLSLGVGKAVCSFCGVQCNRFFSLLRCSGMESRLLNFRRIISVMMTTTTMTRTEWLIFGPSTFSRAAWIYTWNQKRWPPPLHPRVRTTSISTRTALHQNIES